tara:strand:- start:167 stop:436 length:270 start_codon:yes stop_codon:yes gene_type:complete
MDKKKPGKGVASKKVNKQVSDLTTEKKSKYPTKGMNALASERPDVAKKIMGYKEGGMADKRSPFMGGGIAYAGGGKAMKRPMLKKGGKV